MVRLALQAGDDEYSLLVNLKRLYELQLSKPVKNDSLFEDMYRILSHLRDMDNEVRTLSCLSLNTLIFSVQSAVASILSLFS
jgi:cohesin complex subunit SA-1/2